MALATYTDLLAAIPDWMGRTRDSNIANRAADFIALFEARVARDFRVAQMEVQYLLAVASEFVPLPSDFLEMRNIYIQANPTQALDQIGLQTLREQYDESWTGTPQVFAISNGELTFAPVPDTVYAAQMVYYAWTPLSTANPTNWLLTQYPDLYLFGSLIEAKSFIEDGEAVAAWEARFDKAFASLTMADWRRANTANAAMSVGAFTP